MRKNVFLRKDLIIVIMIEIKNLCRSFNDEGKQHMILDNVQFYIKPGTFTAILGRNGSGKSTLAKHMNGLMKPQQGTVTVDGLSTADTDHIFDIREKVGIVFQNPQSQAVAAIVEDDTAFAPENLGLPENEILKRIEFALNETGIAQLRNKPINELSGGQKQLAAISGILAMKPDYMVFDESSSMLDPASRKKILDCILKLKNELNIAIVWITHYMEEAVLADRVIIADNGKIKADGTPEDIFSNTELISESGLSMPPCAQLCIKLRNSGLNIPYIPLNVRDCAEVIAQTLGGKYDRT